MKTGIISALFILVVAGGLSAAPIDTNLLTNPGFESDLTGWSTDNGSIRTSNPLPHGGMNYLMGGNKATSYTSQNIDLLAGRFTEMELDSGVLSADYGGWQSGWSTQTDSGKIEIKFKNTGGGVLSTHDLRWFYSNHTWVLHEGSEVLPAGTRSITYGFYAVRHQGNNNDGYLDDAFLMLKCLVGGVQGDTDGDHDVDVIDFGNLVAQFGGPPGADSADFNCDNFVDLDDFAIQRGNFGFGIVSAPEAEFRATTPEPATLSLLALGGLALIRRRKRGICK